MNRNEADERTMQDLVDTLFAEAMFAEADIEWLAPEAAGEHRLWRWWLSRKPADCVLIAVRAGIAQACERVPGGAVDRVGPDGTVTRLDPVAFMRLVAEHLTAPDQAKGIALFVDMLDESLAQSRLSCAEGMRPDEEALTDAHATLLALERWAAMRDRPFHPVGKGKHGLNASDYRRYMAEFGSYITLDWVAVAREDLMLGAGADPARPPATHLLDHEDRAALDGEMALRGLADSHVGLPVHPWQRSHALPHHLASAIADGRCVPLDLSAGRFAATSSVRSLMPVVSGRHQLKLPLAIHSLAASRYLPAVKMINGQRSERLLREAMSRDLILASQLFLCEEDDWWAYFPAGASLYDEPPRHLSAMVRHYPAILLDNPVCRLVPMAALGVADPDWHYFDIWLLDRHSASSDGEIIALFGELCRRFFDCQFRLFRLGLLPEAHGQNTLLVLREGGIAGFLFRDHDSLRLYVPWLEREGLADPRYEIKPGHTNTLYHDTPEALLFWLQTLGVQVNLRAILESLGMRYSLAQSDLWLALRAAIGTAIDDIHADPALRALLTHELLDRPDWPLKHLVRPIIERAGGPGSMPFGTGRTVNPLARVRDLSIAAAAAMSVRRGRAA
jgi:siderophore synthetase component